VPAESLRFDNLAAAQAGRADAHAFRRGAHASMHRTQVYVPAPLGDIVGVADTISRLRLLAADVALLCHDDSRNVQFLMGNLIFYGIINASGNRQARPSDIMDESFR
jgi:hypothetical protein